jgi:hypothetical protein
MDKLLPLKLYQFPEITCRVRPRRNFLSVLNRASQIKQLQIQPTSIVANDCFSDRGPKCLSHFSEILTS